MSEHRATLKWERGETEFTYQEYPRDHRWQFEGGITVPASAAPAYLGNADLVDPEEAFVASISSCHMLTFLALACKAGFVVDAYADDAVGTLEKTGPGKLAITRAVLRPRIEFSGETRPSEDEISQLHHEAHERCFIANSVSTAITVEAALAAAPR